MASGLIFDYGTGQFTENSENNFGSIVEQFKNLEVKTPISIISQNLQSADLSTRLGAYEEINKQGLDITKYQELSHLANDKDYQSWLKSKNSSTDHWSNFKDTMSGTATALGVLGKLTSGAMGIANAIATYKNINKQSELIDEQIAASQEARQQRVDEITRLNKVRGNTKKQFNTSAVVSRSY